MEIRHSPNSYEGSYLHLVPLRDLPQSHRDLIFSHYGLPQTDMTTVDRIRQEMDNLSEVSVPNSSPRKSHGEKSHRYPETGYRQSDGTPLSKIMNLMKNGNKQGLSQYLEDLYSDYCVFRRALGYQPRSRNQFYAMLRQQLKRNGQMNDMKLLSLYPNR